MGSEKGGIGDAGLALHGGGALQEERRGRRLSQVSGQWPDDARGPVLRVELDRREPGALLPTHGNRRPPTARPMDGELERPDGFRGVFCHHVEGGCGKNRASTVDIPGCLGAALTERHISRLAPLSGAPIQIYAPITGSDIVALLEPEAAGGEVDPVW